MKTAYFPGCSLEGTARLDYSKSMLGVCKLLEIDVEEVPDWNCCGATAAHCLDHQASIDLAGRNLKIAGQMSQEDMLVPCPMCYNRLKTAAQVLKGDHKDRYQTELDSSFPAIWDLANFFARDDILEKVKARIKRPLSDLKVVSYYGCMASRPPEMTGSSDYENPQSIDKVISALGGTTINWPYKTDCCGASLILSQPDIVFQLVNKLYEMARRVGAEAIVVSCQMCQANLDMYQCKIEAEWGQQYSLPVYYFTELIALACELPEVGKWLTKHISNPFPLLEELALYPYKIEDPRGRGVKGKNGENMNTEFR